MPEVVVDLIAEGPPRSPARPLPATMSPAGGKGNRSTVRALGLSASGPAAAIPWRRPSVDGFPDRAPV